MTDPLAEALASLIEYRDQPSRAIELLQPAVSTSTALPTAPARRKAAPTKARPASTRKAATEGAVCETCAAPLTYAGTGRKPRFCPKHKSAAARTTKAGPCYHCNMTRRQSPCEHCGSK